MNKLKLSGFIAWSAWLLVHLVLLIGFRNRLIVLLNWAWQYFTYRSGARA
jgi:NADH dehydrogenase